MTSPNTIIASMVADYERLQAENVSLKLEQSMRKMAEQSNAKLLAEIAKYQSNAAACHEQFMEVSREAMSLKTELREISEAIDDPAINLTKTAVECINDLKLRVQLAEGCAARNQETTHICMNNIRALKEELEVALQERNHAMEHYERSVRILTGIHAMLYPPRFTDNDGRTWQFKSPLAEEQMQELSDRIRALPDEIEAIEQEKESNGQHNQ